MSNDFIDEKDIPKNWEPVDSTTRTPLSAPAPPLPNEMPPYFVGSMPPALQHDTSFVGTEVGTARIPKYSVMPLGLQSSPFTNAAVQSTAGATAPSQLQDIGIGLVAPKEIVVTGTPAGAKGTFVLQWAPENPFTVFSGPFNDTFGFDFGFSGGGNAVIGPGHFEISAGFPSQVPEWALYVATFVSRSALGAPVGNWTPLPLSSSAHPFYTQTLSAETSVASVQQATTGNDGSQVGTVLYFGGAAPTPVQSISQGNGGTNLTLALPGNATAGNSLLVIFTGLSTYDNSPLAIDAEPTFSDTQGNTFHKIEKVSTNFDPTFGQGARLYVYLVNNLQAAPESVIMNVHGGGPHDFPVVGNLTLFEIGPLTAVAQVPRFQNISAIPPDQLPLIDINTGTTGHPLLAINGGTGLTDSGTANNVLTADGAGGWTSSPVTALAKYQTVQDNGSNVPQEAKLNFIGATVADDPGNNRTNVTITGGAGTALEVNGSGISSDKLIFVNGIQVVTSVWAITVNGTPIGG